MNLLTESIADFMNDGFSVFGEEKIAFLAKKYNKTFNQINSVIVFFSEDLAMDINQEKHFFDEYKGDAEKFGKWVESYIADTIEDRIEEGIFDEIYAK